MELCHQKPGVKCVREGAPYMRKEEEGEKEKGGWRNRNKNTTLNQTVKKSWLKFAPAFFPVCKENNVCKTPHKSFKW